MVKDRKLCNQIVKFTSTTHPKVTFDAFPKQCGLAASSTLLDQKKFSVI